MDVRDLSVSLPSAGHDRDARRDKVPQHLELEVGGTYFDNVTVSLLQGIECRYYGLDRFQYVSFCQRSQKSSRNNLKTHMKPFHTSLMPSGLASFLSLPCLCSK